MIHRALIVALLTVLASAAQAEGTAISVHGSVEGGGVELTTRFADTYNARFAYHQYTYQGTDLLALLRQISQITTDLFGLTQSDIFYDHHGKQSIASVMTDWYPYPENQFRLTAGLSHNNDVDTLLGRELILGGYNIGNHQYSASQVGKLQGALRSNRFAPYLGCGWGNAVAKHKKWGWMVDAGLMYRGKPDITLTANNAVQVADLELEKAKLQKDKLPVTLLLSAGMSFQW